MKIRKNFGKRIGTWTPVLVTWNDATGTPGWTDQKDIRTRPVQIETIAFFYQEFNDSIHLAQSVDEHKTPQLGDHLIIPTGCVISIEKLK